LKVLHLFNEINFSGAELMYANAAEIFQSNGIEMLAFNTGKSKGNFISEFNKKNIKVYHKPIKKGINFSLKIFKFYWHFYRFLKNEKIAVLHIHRSDLYMVTLCSRIAKVRTIKTIHNVFRHRTLTHPYGVAQRFVARKLLNVKFQTIGKSVYENELNYYHNPSKLINNWYNSNLFYPKKDENEVLAIKKKLGINKDTFIVTSVGGCSNIKRHDQIIKSLGLIKSKIKFEYLHLGSGVTETNEKKTAKKLGIIDRIHFLGNKNNVRDYLIASDVYIMTSEFEGLTISGLEAMGCALPLIFYDAPGLRDLIKNDDNGFLINPNYHILADKIMEFYSKPYLKVEKGLSSFKHVKKNYSMEINVDKIISLYNA